MYSTAGATVIADVITSNDVNSNDSEKINICNKMKNFSLKVRFCVC